MVRAVRVVRVVRILGIMRMVRILRIMRVVRFTRMVRVVRTVFKLWSRETKHMLQVADGFGQEARAAAMMTGVVRAWWDIEFVWSMSISVRILVVFAVVLVMMPIIVVLVIVVLVVMLLMVLLTNLVIITTKLLSHLLSLPPRLLNINFPSERELIRPSQPLQIQLLKVPHTILQSFYEAGNTAPLLIRLLIPIALFFFGMVLIIT